MHKWGTKTIYKVNSVLTVIMKPAIFKELFERPGGKKTRKPFMINQISSVGTNLHAQKASFGLQGKDAVYNLWAFEHALLLQLRRSLFSRLAAVFGMVLSHVSFFLCVAVWCLPELWCAGGIWRSRTWWDALKAWGSTSMRPQFGTCPLLASWVMSSIDFQ